MQGKCPTVLSSWTLWSIFNIILLLFSYLWDINANIAIFFTFSVKLGRVVIPTHDNMNCYHVCIYFLWCSKPESTWNFPIFHTRPYCLPVFSSQCLKVRISNPLKTGFLEYKIHCEVRCHFHFIHWLIFLEDWFSTCLSRSVSMHFIGNSEFISNWLHPQWCLEFFWFSKYFFTRYVFVPLPPC